MRRQATHKAQPIKNYKPVTIKQSEKPVTVPKTPNFATISRLKTRAASNMSLNSTVSQILSSDSDKTFSS